MAHRPIPRVLGETSLEVKCLALFGVFLLLVVGASFLSYWRVTEKVVQDQSPRTGRVMAERAMMTIHWDGCEAREFATVARKFRQNMSDLPFEVEGYHRKEDLPAGKAETPATHPGPRPEVKAWVISPNPEVRDLQPKSDFERQVLRDFAKPKSPSASPEPEYRESFAAGHYDYYQPFRFKKGCSDIPCHQPDTTGRAFGEPQTPEWGSAAPGGVAWAEGDLMGVVHVQVPKDPDIDHQIQFYWNVHLAVAIVTAFLGMIAFYVTLRYLIVRPMKHLRDVSDAISHGNVALRADIRTGDEFESLGVAFNRMLRHLVTMQDELRQANVELDGKVDELAQLNMQLYEMNRVKSDFLATMSHELRTPLNSILGFSDVLGSIDALDDKQKRYVQNIQKSGRMLLEMINNILDLAKIESGKMDIRLVEFSIEHVVQAQCDMARPLTEKKNIDLETDIQPGLPPLMQDQSRVQQLLNNLLSNAIKFTPEGGRIMVAANRSERGDLLMRVIDTGVGIAEEDQQIIFEKFRQGRTAMPGGDAMTREYSGTGLGLSIVKELCRLLEGEVSVQSELGTGSAFTVRLPWILEKKPRLESPMAVSLEKFSKARLDLSHDGVPASENGLKTD
jgi:predicted CxxxxCH...CXXCH cytochrome family protein